MSFPQSLSPSPVHAAFTGIQWDPLENEMFRLTEPEKSLLRSAEDNVLDYTLADRDDAAAYASVLLKVLDQATEKQRNNNKERRVVQCGLDEILSAADALPLLYVDMMGVVSHYAITKLTQVIVSLQSKSTKGNVNMISTFYPKGMLGDDWRPLLRVLHMGRGTADAFAQRGSAYCLAHILIAGCPSQQQRYNNNNNNNASLLLLPQQQNDCFSSVKEPLQALVSWIASRLQSSTGSCLLVVNPTLTVLMHCHEARIFFDKAGGIGYLARHARRRPQKNQQNTQQQNTQQYPNNNNNNNNTADNNNNNQGAFATVQQLYDICFCLWVMTYECSGDGSGSDAIRNHFHRDGAVHALVDLVAAAPREKVVRVALAALRNLATCGDDHHHNNNDQQIKTTNGRKSSSPYNPAKVFLTEMIGCGLLKSIDLMRERQWKDPDLLDDLSILYARLHENYKEMSRWDVYKSEIDSGYLEWGICHSETFFRENARRFEGPDGNFHLIKTLIKLTQSADEDVAAIACYDIGEFVRHYPNGRAIAKRLGAKDLIIKMIEHENPNLQRHALQCVTKMMVQNWAAVS